VVVTSSDVPLTCAPARAVGKLKALEVRTDSMSVDVEIGDRVPSELEETAA
jgi:hypothetical protein